MEFIPLERYSKTNAKKKRATDADERKIETQKLKKLKKNEEKDTGVTKIKRKPQPKVIEKKNVKNKFRETLISKKKNRVPKRKVAKKRQEEEDVEEEEENYGKNEIVEEEEEEENYGKNEIVEEEENEVHDNQNERDEDEKDSEEEAFRRKCKELDDKKKNRLFVKLRKKIYSEAQIKELHSDIRSVIFPRKKNSRWCWAVFTSEEKANEAMKKLVKNKDILVNKPNPYERVVLKRKKKMKTVLQKKEARKKLQKMWM